MVVALVVQQLVLQQMPQKVLIQNLTPPLLQAAVLAAVEIQELLPAVADPAVVAVALKQPLAQEILPILPLHKEQMVALAIQAINGVPAVAAQALEV